MLQQEKPEDFVNAAERALRAFALGRRNFLFVGSDSGGEWSAAMARSGTLSPQRLA